MLEPERTIHEELAGVYKSIPNPRASDFITDEIAANSILFCTASAPPHSAPRTEPLLTQPGFGCGCPAILRLRDHGQPCAVLLQLTDRLVIAKLIACSIVAQSPDSFPMLPEEWESSYSREASYECRRRRAREFNPKLCAA